jgi:hypothetical protein
MPNNDGTKILFSDEWGGGGQRCRATDKLEWPDALFTIDSNRKMKFHRITSRPRRRRPENCVAHNGSIPIPGRDDGAVVVPGRLSVFD